MFSSFGPARRCAAILLAAPLLVCMPAPAQLRVANWNVTNYASGRTIAFQTAIFGVNPDNGLSMDPDILVCQEFLHTQTAVDNFRCMLNGTGDCTGDWASAPFANGPDTDNACFYRASRVELLAATVISPGATSPPAPTNHPRDVTRYDFRILGYSSNEGVISIYSSHMKSGGGSLDEARRRTEAQAIRADAAARIAAVPGSHFILGGDFNIQNAAWASYQDLVGPLPSEDGRFFDPIASPGSWNNNCAFSFIHTQDPKGNGGMDDRHDQLLLGASLVDGAGLDYVGDPLVPFSNMTWNDPNHSYRAWGNDGTTCNGNLRVIGNTMVGPVIAQALRDTVPTPEPNPPEQVPGTTGGHLPVFLDLRLPAEIAEVAAIDFGTVEQGAIASLDAVIANAGDTALWSEAGIADLVYTLSAPAPFSVGSGPFADPAGGVGNAHAVVLDTSTPGTYMGTLVINSNAPDAPVTHVQLAATVQAPPPVCAGDANGDLVVNFADLNLVVGNFGSSTTPGTTGDVNGDGTVNFADLNQVLGNFGAGCA